MGFYDIFKSRTKLKDGILWNQLNKNEQEELIATFEDSENPENLIDHEKMKKKAS